MIVRQKCCDLVIPQNGIKTDWEVELAVVIGNKAKYVSEQDAMSYVAGYVLHNDYSEREFQLEPYHFGFKVNGIQKQKSNTSEMVIFDVPHLVSYISQYMSLLPGDIISTGTPEGVGLGFKPPQFLKHGDVVELGIEGLGASRQNFKSAV